jgi:LysR family glycine cleavage system transcriptional activator
LFMQKLRTQLPPLNSLVAFEASARHLSFTRAGHELLVSREAVSRQIRLLEGHLGVKLFRRLHRAVELTRDGEEFHGTVKRGLEGIARAAEVLQRRGQPAKITVTATVAIASCWLTPRLPKFRAAHPDAEIRVMVSDSPPDLAAEGIDVGFRYGDGKWPGLRAVRLFAVSSFPVCAPGYLQAAPAIAGPADLMDHTLLNLDGAPHAMEDWYWWLQGAGVRGPTSLQILGFDNYANVIQAALDGQGVALGFGGIVDDYLAAGELVRPLAATLSKGFAVYLTAPASARLPIIAGRRRTPRSPRGRRPATR